MGKRRILCYIVQKYRPISEKAPAFMESSYGANSCTGDAPMEQYLFNEKMQNLGGKISRPTVIRN
jgi:hypothetical protein